MQSLIASRWYVLVGALICGAAMLLPVAMPSSQYWNVRPEALMLFAPFLQGGGTFAMSRALAARGVKAKLSVAAGYISAAAWLIAVIGGVLGQAAGAGGLVFGFFLVLPGIAIGLLTQIAAFIGFVRAEKPAAT